MTRQRVSARPANRARLVCFSCGQLTKLERARSLLCAGTLAELRDAVMGMRAEQAAMRAEQAAMRAEQAAVRAEQAAVRDKLESVYSEQAAMRAEQAAVRDRLESTHGIVMAMQAEQLADAASSWMSPTGKDYERYVNGVVDGWLATHCGLRVVPTSRRDLPSSDLAAKELQWDARFSVELIERASLQRTRDIGSFVVYGGGEYCAPAPIPLRRLS